MNTHDDDHPTCSHCPPDCVSCWPPDCECYAHQDWPDRRFAQGDETA